MGRPGRRLRAGCMGLLGTLALAGCGMRPESDPVTWWHDLSGGKIAEQRPPPPRADQPYPHLSQVPPRPATEDPATRGRIAASLTVERADAQYGQVVDPLPPQPARPPEPAAAETAGATMPAAETPQATARPASRAPTRAPAAGTVLDPTAPLPLDIPAGPPKPADLSGVPRVTAAAPPPKAPPVVAAATPRAPRDPVTVAFAADSAVLPPEAPGALRALATARSGDDIVITGFGGAADVGAGIQAQTLGLAFARARAMAASLAAAGVPVQAMRITAVAEGQGGVVRLVR